MLAKFKNSNLKHVMFRIIKILSHLYLAACLVIMKRDIYVVKYTYHIMKYFFISLNRYVVLAQFSNPN